MAMAVQDMVRNCMKGQPEPLIERAVLQARQEADFLYILIGDVNQTLRTSEVCRAREYSLIRGQMRAVNQARKPDECIEELRSGVLMVLRRVLIVEGAIPRVGAAHFRKQPILFNDSESKLKLQIGMVEVVIESFNAIARKLGVAEINLDDLRSSLRAKIEREVTTWVDAARLAMLASFGEEKEYRAEQDAMFAS